MKRMIRIGALLMLALTGFTTVLAIEPEPVSDTTKPRTLFGSGEFTSGGFGGPVAKVTSIDGNTSLLVGGRGAWVINKTIAIGGGGYGLVTPRTLREGVGTTDRDTMMNLGYGGAEIEFIISSSDLLHLSVMTLVGAGDVSTTTSRTMWDEDDERGSGTITSDAFFVLEPQVNVELNVTDWFRMAAGVSYRLVNGVDSQVGSIKLDDKMLSGVAGVLTFKFGIY